MAEEKKQQGFLKGAAVLSVATILVKFVGIFFSIPLANKLGEAAMGYYNVAYNLFALFNAAATAGVPIAMSRMVSAAYTLGRKKQADRIFSVAAWTFSLVGLLCAGLMYFFHSGFARLMGMSEAKYAIQALAPTVFFCAFMSAVRGYFQGRSNMLPTAVSQVIEAVTKLVVGLGLSFYVFDRTGNGALSAAAAIIGVSVSAGLGALYSLLYKLWYSAREGRQKREERPSEECDSGKEIFRTLIHLAVPITLGACFTYFLDSMDGMTVNRSLRSIAGFDEEYTASLVGVWFNTVKLYDLPGGIIIPLSTSVLPVLTAAFTRGDLPGMEKTINSVIRMTLLIAIPCTVGFVLFGNDLAAVMYYSREMSRMWVGRLLGMVSLSVIFNGILYTTNAVLQSMGNVKRPVLHMIIGGMVKILLNFLLVPIPALNIMGVPISNVLSNLVVAFLNLRLIRKLVPKTDGVLSTALPLGISALIMGAGAWGVNWGLKKLLPMLLGGVLGETVLRGLILVLTVIAAVVFYFGGTVLLHGLRSDDLRMLPKGDRLVEKLRLQEGKRFR